MAEIIEQEEELKKEQLKKRAALKLVKKYLSIQERVKK